MNTCLQTASSSHDVQGMSAKRPLGKPFLSCFPCPPLEWLGRLGVATHSTRTALRKREQSPLICLTPGLGHPPGPPDGLTAPLNHTGATCLTGAIPPPTRTGWPGSDESLVPNAWPLRSNP